MLEIPLHIHFISDWHVGSGLGNGAIADAVLNRDAGGLPYIPGSALKGALREGAWRLALCPAAAPKWLTDHFFGTNSQDKTTNESGILFFSQAQLPDDLRHWLLSRNAAERQEFVADMTILRRQTALAEKTRIAKDHSLRTLECGIPGLRFSGTVSADIPPEGEEWFRAWLAAVCACVKSIGGDRSRGLGRCRVFTGDAPPAKAVLPGPVPECLCKGAKSHENA